MLEFSYLWNPGNVGNRAAGCETVRAKNQVSLSPCGVNSEVLKSSARLFVKGSMHYIISSLISVAGVAGNTTTGIVFTSDLRDRKCYQMYYKPMDLKQNQ